MVTNVERTCITLPIGLVDECRKLGVNISGTCRIALRREVAHKGLCPLHIAMDDGCPIVGDGCKGSYQEWRTCPQNTHRMVISNTVRYDENERKSFIEKMAKEVAKVGEQHG